MGNNFNPDVLTARLKLYRAEKKFTQAQVAEKLGISTVNYAKYECGARIPSLSKIVDIALLFDKPLYSFIEQDKPSMCLTAEQIARLRSLDRNQLIAILGQLQKLCQDET